MGLCKCPKRRVTNMFCFEHRVNVCEHCVATNHTKCIIQSYLQWLQDSDYSPVCELCSRPLELEDCIRLTCYHIFHWGCVDVRERHLPATTAPAGRRCPTCQAAIFPPGNASGPVANALRERLVGVNWARNGLGLPLLSEDREVRPLQSSAGGGGIEPIKAHSAANSAKNGGSGDSVVRVIAEDDEDLYDGRTGNYYGNGRKSNINNNNFDQGLHQQEQQQQEQTAPLLPPRGRVYHDAGGATGNHAHHHNSSGMMGQQQRPLLVPNPSSSSSPQTSFDRDDDKYKRRPAGEWMRRWWKNALGSQQSHRSYGINNHNRVGSLYKRYCLLGLSVFLAIGVLLYVMSKLGRYSVENDPNLELYQNPQIHVNAMPDQRM